MFGVLNTVILGEMIRPVKGLLDIQRLDYTKTAVSRTPHMVGKGTQGGEVPHLTGGMGF